MTMNPIPQRTKVQQVQRVLARHEALIILIVGIVIGFLLSRV